MIRAEVIGWPDFESQDSEQAAKAAGRHRVEGEDYVVQDGDVINVGSPSTHRSTMVVSGHEQKALLIA